MNPRFIEAYTLLLNHFGHRKWWPGRSRFEVCVGAVLTQNTAWVNVERAIKNLKAAGKLSIKALLDSPDDELALLIRPSGYFNMKARRLKELAGFLIKEGGERFNGFKSLSDMEFREKLLKVKGIGPETADSILLYAFNRPVFVVDAYTRRISARLGWAEPDASYEELQVLFSENIQDDVSLYNDYHAQIVALGANFCKPKPNCEPCPLSGICQRRGL